MIIKNFHFVKQMRIPLLGASLILLLSACASSPTTPTKPLAEHIDVTEIELSEAAIAVNDSMQRLSAVSAQQAPRIYLQNDESFNTALGMNQLITVNWSGPIEPLIKALARTSDYRLQVFGNAPAIPAMVTINKRNTTAGAVLQDAKIQVNDRVDVYVFPDIDTIELHYLS